MPCASTRQGVFDRITVYSSVMNLTQWFLQAARGTLGIQREGEGAEAVVPGEGLLGGRVIIVPDGEYSGLRLGMDRGVRLAGR